MAFISKMTNTIYLMVAMPPNKKQKIDVAPPLAPISFDVPGLPAHVSLNVFGQEFLVHSAVLMLHSGFFRQFLHAPANERPTPRFPGDVSLQWVKQAYPKEWRLLSRTSNAGASSLVYALDMC
jgi:hypothetical protein